MAGRVLSRVPRWQVSRLANYLRRQPKKPTRKSANLLPSGVTKRGSAAQRIFAGGRVSEASRRRAGARSSAGKAEGSSRARAPPTASDPVYRTCRPRWDLDPGLWRLSEEGRFWARRPNYQFGWGLGQSFLALNIQSRTSTVGFVGGADLTSRGLFFTNDG